MSSIATRRVLLCLFAATATLGLTWACDGAIGLDPCATNPDSVECGGGSTDTEDLCALVDCDGSLLGPCKETFCDSATGDCVIADIADDTYCSTGDVCIIAQWCEAGVCMGDEKPSPNCLDLECGLDECGFECGLCEDGLECTDGECLPPCDLDCEDKDCGDDGCNGVCGTCGDTEFCNVDQQCELACEPECGDAVCGDDGCGGSCGDCGDGFFCDAGTCGEDCVPQCNGLQCGDDGCGSTCGDCAEDFDCSDEGQCVDPLPSCGVIPSIGCCDGLSLKFCQDDVLETVPCETVCGWLADADYYDCDGNASGADPTGTHPIECPVE